MVWTPKSKWFEFRRREKRQGNICGGLLQSVLVLSESRVPRKRNIFFFNVDYVDIIRCASIQMFWLILITVNFMTWNDMMDILAILQESCFIDSAASNCKCEISFIHPSLNNNFILSNWHFRHYMAFYFIYCCGAKAGSNQK